MKRGIVKSLSLITALLFAAVTFLFGGVLFFFGTLRFALKIGTKKEGKNTVFHVNKQIEVRLIGFDP